MADDVFLPHWAFWLATQQPHLVYSNLSALPWKSLVCVC